MLADYSAPEQHSGVSMKLLSNLTEPLYQVHPIRWMGWVTVCQYAGSPFSTCKLTFSHRVSILRSMLQRPATTCRGSPYRGGAYGDCLSLFYGLFIGIWQKVAEYIQNLKFP